MVVRSGSRLLLASSLVAAVFALLLAFATSASGESDTHGYQLSLAATVSGHVFVTSAERSLTGPAETDVVYSQSFTGAAGAEWSSKEIETSPQGERFLGRFGNDTVRLTLSNLPQHEKLVLEVSVYIIDSWDGNNTTFGPDIFTIRGGGQTLKETTFSNLQDADFPQAFPGNFESDENPAATGAASKNTLGFPPLADPLLGDSTYLLELPISHDSDTVTFSFSARGLIGQADETKFTDESWGIDNVVVRTAGGSCEERAELAFPGQVVNVVEGTDGDDMIAGTAGTDVICALAGDDTIDAGGGEDLVFAGEGDDVVKGGEGIDTLHGEGGSDQLFGQGGNDTISGGGGKDRLFGAQGNDTLRGGVRADMLVGGSGDDDLDGGPGNDQLVGGQGSDTLDGDAGGDTLSGGARNDLLLGGSGRDTLFGGPGNDRLTGGSGRDNLTGGAGIDRYFARDNQIDTINLGLPDTGVADAVDDTDILNVVVP